MSEIRVVSAEQRLDDSVRVVKAVNVLSRTQRIVVASNKSVTVVNAGPPGPRGLKGQDTGEQGPQGPPGAPQWTGEGPPGTIIGAQPGQIYLDRLTGDLYQLQ